MSCLRSRKPNKLVRRGPQASGIASGIGGFVKKKEKGASSFTDLISLSRLSPSASRRTNNFPDYSFVGPRVRQQ